MRTSIICIFSGCILWMMASNFIVYVLLPILLHGNSFTTNSFVYDILDAKWVEHFVSEVPSGRESLFHFSYMHCLALRVPYHY